MRLNRKIFALLIAVLMAVGLATTAYAADYSVTVSIPVAVTRGGDVPTDSETFVITLKALDGAPLPGGAEGDEATLTCEGAGSVTFDDIKLPGMGIYRYEVSQGVPSPDPRATSYDETVYLVQFYAMNAGRVNTIIKPIRPEEGHKVEEIEFENEYEMTTVTATKFWDDYDNQDGKRGDVTLVLSGEYFGDDGMPHAAPITVVEPAQTITLGGNLEVTWDELPVYYEGKSINYDVDEQGTVDREGELAINFTGDDDGWYTVFYDSDGNNNFTVVNTHEPETTYATVTKKWNDNNDQDGFRPESLTVTLLADGEALQALTLAPDEDGAWTATVEDLPKYTIGEDGKCGKEIEYTWSEDEETLNGIGYELQSNVNNGTDTILVNYHETGKTLATVVKVWDDADDQDGIRPGSLNVTLTANGEDVETVTLEPGVNGVWTATIDDLDEYADGELIKYDWREEDLPDTYKEIKHETVGAVTAITNEHVPEETKASVKKVWVDGEDSNDTRPESLTVTLSPSGNVVELNQNNGWSATVTNLPKYTIGEDGKGGKEIEYTWDEGSIAKYEKTDETPGENGLTTITNTLIDEKNVEVSGEKTWVDGGKTHNNASEITLTLTRTSAKAGSEAEDVDATPTWTGNKYTFSGLDKYDDEGYAYTYDVEEAQVINYDAPEKDGLNFTNTIHDPEDTEVSGEKTWVDGGKEHDNATEITLTLKRTANGKTETVEATPTWEDDTYKYTGLDKYDDGGYEYTYTVTEKTVSGYDEPEYSGNDITNTITDNQDVKVEGTKTWVDGGKEHENASEITLTLERTANGKTETVDAEPTWTGNKYTFSGLDKYDDEGYEYTYTVTEAQVDGYDAPEQSGNDITNTIHDDEDVEVSGEKTWVDGGKEHDNATEIKLTLKRTANGKTETVNETPTWEGDTYKYTGLDKYDDGGYEYTYTVTEDRVSGYDAPEYSGNDITNTITDNQDVKVEGTKTWVDGGKTHDNATEITLTLERTSAKEGSEAEVVEATPTWTGNKYTFSGLDKYDDEGYEYTYTVTEAQVDGYDEPEQSGNDITNTIHDDEDVEVSGEKTWVDGGKEHDNAAEITLTLKRTANGKTETVGATPTWEGDTYKYTGLDKYDDGGYEYTYTVTETKVSGYDDPEYSGNDITNTITDNQDVKVEGEKTWVDGGKTHDNATEIKLTLKRTANGKTETVDATPTWTGNKYTFSGLDKYDDEGYEYTYSVTEAQVEGYDAPEKDGNSFTNTIHDPEDTEVSGEKTWVDGGKEHDNATEITLTLKRTANGKTETVGATPTWEGDTYKYTGLDKYDDGGYEYTYTVTETKVSGYDDPEYDGNDITNTITDNQDVEVSGEKTWVDGGKEHDNASEITLTLERTSAKEGSEAEVVEATPTWNGNKYTFSGLDKYDDEGYEYTYTVTETQVDGYDEPEQSGNDITNTIHDDEDVEVSGEKTWVDGGKEHDNATEITLTLKRTANGKTETVGATPTWEGDTYKYTGLDKYDDGGYEYTYTVTETKVSGYDDPEYDGNDITNTITDNQDVEVSGEKTWVDGGKEHDNASEITLTLERTSAKEGSEAEVVEATPTWNGNKYTFSGLDKYDDEGYEYTYTVTETQVDGYDEPEQSGNDITNTIHDDEDVEVSGEKTWVDGGKEHDNATEIKLTLKRTANGKTETVNETPTWEGDTYKYTGLDKYDDGGYEYTYTVTEDRVSGYDVPEYSGNDITNTITDNQDVKVEGEKTWVDGGKEHNNASEITLTLERTSAKEGSEAEVVEATPTWTGNKYTFSGLDKYDDEGYEYTYSVTEAQVDGYDEPEQSGNDITNTIHDNEDVEVSGEKTWVDGGKEHDNATEITLTLKRTANGKTETVEATPTWIGNTYKYTGLDKYDDGGYEYTYAVTETKVSGYDDPEYDGNDITNTITDNQDVEVSGEKTWIDGGKEHDNATEIKLTLKRTANGKTETVDAEPTWSGNKYTFSGLDKYDDEGYEYTYSVTEAQVEGYDAPEKDGNSFTNTIHDDQDVEVSGEKTWVDGGKEHDNATEITLTLKRTANGKTETVNETPTWEGDTYKYTGLDKYDDGGYEYTYTVTETKVSGYNDPEYDGNDITNTITDNQDVEVSGEKTWVDGGKEHDNASEITLTLERTSAKEGSEAEVVEATPTWTGNKYTFSGLDKYDDEGYEYTYSVTEAQVEGYDAPEKDGNSFTNTIHDDEDVEVSGEKTWVDGGKEHDNATEIALTLKRTANAKTETVDATPTWEGDTYKYTGLDKYDDGGYEYTYTVIETQVEGYDAPEYSGNDITNTITDNEDVEVSGEKTWVDGGKEHNNATEITLTLERTSAKAGSEAEVVDATPTWTGNKYTFSGLDKYDDEGYEYTYAVTEAQVEGYDEPEQSGNDITNTIHDDEDVEVSGEKTWVDGGKEHDNATEIALTLKRTANGKTETVEATPTWEGDTYKYTGLDKYDDGGYEYTYAVTEAQVSGYDAPEYDGNDITNTITDNEDVEVSGEKKWVDGGKEHNNASEITLTLSRTSAKAGSEAEVVEATPTWNGNKYMFSGLDKYDDEGYEYSYDVTEVKVEGYTVQKNGNDLTNTIEQEYIELTIVKIWDDNGWSGAPLPESLKATLSDGTEVTLNEKNEWKATVSDLPKYDETGAEIVYTWTEEPVAEYEMTDMKEADGVTTLTNTYVTPVIHDPPVRKIITGGTPSTDATFTFKLAAKSNTAGYAVDSMPMPDGEQASSVTMTITGAQEKEFGIITFDKEGTYIYEVSEVKTGTDGYTYDDSVYTLTYVITLNEEACAYEKDLTVTKDGEVYEKSVFEFTNEYTEPSVPGAPVKVKKVLTGDKPETAATFNMTLAAKSNTAGISVADMPMPEGASAGKKSVGITAGEEKSFGAITFDKAGTYVYEVSEVNSGLANYTYDTTVYTVTYEVVVEDGKLAIRNGKPTVTKGGAAVTDETLTFTNKYKKTGTSTDETPKTGVQDNWPYLLGGAVLLLLAAVIMIVYLRRSREEKH